MRTALLLSLAKLEKRKNKLWWCDLKNVDKYFNFIKEICTVMPKIHGYNTELNHKSLVFIPKPNSLAFGFRYNLNVQDSEFHCISF